MMKKIREFFKVYDSEETRAVFEENEYAANRLSFYVILTCAVILVIAWALNMAGIFTVSKLRMNIVTSCSPSSIITLSSSRCSL